MRQEERHYRFSGFCVLFFIAAQIFQELATPLWIPAPHEAERELMTYLLPMDRTRALLILSSILLLVIPYITIAMRYWLATPLAAASGYLAYAARSLPQLSLPPKEIPRDPFIPMSKATKPDV